MATNIKETSSSIENLKVLAGHCKINGILTSIGLRWKMQLLVCIDAGISQFSKLKKIFPTLSDQVLGKRIAEMLEEGLIEKEEIHTTWPCQFKYEVTLKGKELLEIMVLLNKWGIKWEEKM
ncbi:helix-turn-helix domain-containing protein [Chitinophaga sp. Cy-1792]|uniref:winged helix-turn-helix transcriptional regulator n=1 Tax=Chitinophaga sp. Cy-1792 TaxID=2608339 RepID=UPI0019662602|nr:helix-turn-helix domain-containing protein [Chitinophaga sp. Cy-1792]